MHACTQMDETRPTLVNANNTTTEWMCLRLFVPGGAISFSHIEIAQQTRDDSNDCDAPFLCQDKNTFDRNLRLRAMGTCYFGL
jgi:hypothetical protein